MFKEAKLSSPIILTFKFHRWLHSRERQKCDTPLGTTLGQPLEGTPQQGVEGWAHQEQLWDTRDGALASPGEEPLKRVIMGPFCNAFPKTPAGSHKPPQQCMRWWVVAFLCLKTCAPGGQRDRGCPHHLAVAPASATHSLRDPASAHDTSSRHPHRLQQKSYLAGACNPSACNALTAEVIGGGRRKKRKKKKRERKKEQCAIGTALEMEKVLKACNIHQGWIHKCHILNKPSKRQWQRKGALLQESLSFSFAAVRNLFFASHSISHYSINEVTSHSYWLACQSPCLIP